MRNLNAILVIAYRDFVKMLKDRSRIVGAVIFPLMFVGVLGSSLQANIGGVIGYNFIEYTFTGVLGMTLFQSTAAGIISLIEDRENDFAQELFISPVSRYAIIIGKILGESLVALIQVGVVLVFGLFTGVTYTSSFLIMFMPVALLICLFGGAFGVIVMSQLGSQRAANQIFPFVLFPQYFLAGVFNPIQALPPVLLTLSRISPMTYAVDLVRNVFFAGKPELPLVAIFTPLLNLAVIGGLFVLFLTIGTWLFVRGERNR